MSTCSCVTHQLNYVTLGFEFRRNSGYLHEGHAAGHFLRMCEFALSIRAVVLFPKTTNYVGFLFVRQGRSTGISFRFGLTFRIGLCFCFSVSTFAFTFLAFTFTSTFLTLRWIVSVTFGRLIASFASTSGLTATSFSSIFGIGSIPFLTFATAFGFWFTWGTGSAGNLSEVALNCSVVFVLTRIADGFVQFAVEVLESSSVRFGR